MKQVFGHFVVIAALLTSACSTSTGSGGKDSVIPNTAGGQIDFSQSGDANGAAVQTTVTIEDGTDPNASVIYRQVPSLGSSVTLEDEPIPPQPTFPDERIDVTLPPQTVPDFINSAFGELLEVGFSMGPGVSDRREMVSYRTASGVSKQEFYESVKNVLGDYGLAVIYENDEVTIIQQDQLRRRAPRFIRSRARSAVPNNLRPVVQFVDLLAIEASAMNEILRAAFPDNNQLSIKGNGMTNSITLTGLPEDVDFALSIISQMDELQFANTKVATVQIENWDINELTDTLQRLLSLEGFAVTSQPMVTRAITLFPIEFTKQLVVFARTDEMLTYAVQAAYRMDQAAAQENTAETRVYKALHYKAADLVTLLSNTLSDRSSGPPLPATTPQVQSGDQERSFGAQVMGAFIVDEQGNRIIYRATDREQREILALLRQVDTPADEVMIEVTIAEVTLTDNLTYGMELLFQQLGSQGYSIGVGTRGGLGLATNGLSGQYTSGDYIVDFSAFASNNQINVLQTPRIVTKSGATASIQVGTDVPIITSQSAASTEIGGTTDILQSVEYRETGILLDIEPLVLSEDRIDIRVSQEISAAADNENQSIASPVISNRTIVTELTLQDGQSAILGGLIENRYTRGTSGVPFAKDIPVLGNLFKTESLNSTQTILMVMITPYVLSTRTDRQIVVDSITDLVNEAFDNQINESKTLRRPDQPMRVGRQ